MKYRGLQPRLAQTSFRVMDATQKVYHSFRLPVICTARPFSFYRRVFFGNRREAEVLAELKGQRIVDVGCGLTPYAPDSMFQDCRRQRMRRPPMRTRLTGCEGAARPVGPARPKRWAGWARRLSPSAHQLM